MKTVVVDGRRHKIIRDMGFSPNVNGYGILAVNAKTGSPSLAVRYVGQKNYLWYDDQEKWKNDKVVEEVSNDKV